MVKSDICLVGARKQNALLKKCAPKKLGPDMIKKIKSIG